MAGAERIPLSEHVADATALLAPVRRREAVRVGGSVVGRVAAGAARARVDVPGHDNSQMDGFAVAAADLAGAGQAVTLPLGPVIAAGDRPGDLAPGTARPVMTGAPIPAGAHLVIPVEESAAGRFAPPQEEARAPRSVTLTPATVPTGRFVRRRGSDTRAGDTVVREGQQLTPARLAHLAACGVNEVEVEAPLRVIVLSTGSEVSAPAAASDTTAAAVAAPAPLAPGAAFDANGPGLAAALTAAGAEVVHLGAVPDDAGALMDRLHEQIAATDADLVVTSGGVSAGAFEVVRDAAERPDVTLAFPKVAMQPGGPQGIGTLDLPERRVPWLAFPGNPVSALLSCELIARPALGAPERLRLWLPLRIEAEEPSPPALDQYRRAHVLPSGRVRIAGGSSSHLLGALATANALVIVPAGTEMIHDGDVLETLLLTGGEG